MFEIWERSSGFGDVVEIPVWGHIIRKRLEFICNKREKKTERNSKGIDKNRR
mgnify:FL=1|jgi:hypothetical protein